MQDIAITIKAERVVAKNLEESFVEFVKADLEGSDIHLNRDNSPKAIFRAYLRLASRWHNYEKEIDQILYEIEQD